MTTVVAGGRASAPTAAGWPVAALTGGSAAFAMGCGILIGQLGLAGAGIVLGVLGMAAVAFRPQVAVYAYVGLLPFMAGIPRGDLIPYLRPTEILQLFLTAGVSIPLFVHLLRGRPIATSGTGVERAFVLFAWAGSALPVVWLAERGLPLTLDDMLAVVPIWKYLALFLLVRGCITTPKQVRICLLISVVVAVITGLVAMLQALSLAGVPGLIARYWVPEGIAAADIDNGRGSGFLGSPIATATYVTFNLGIALALLVNERRGRRLLAVAAAVLSVTAFGIGQITGIVALILVAIALGALTGRIPMLMKAGLLVLPLAVALAWPVLQIRLADTAASAWVPRSWTVRWYNLASFYWPELGDFNWILGVRPNSIVQPPDTWRDAIYLENGYIWLLWVGGVPFLGAFLYFVQSSLVSLRRVTRARTDAVGSAALAGSAALLAIVVLTMIDMHITTRGEADLTYVLLALGLGTSDAARAQPGDAPTERRQLASTEISRVGRAWSGRGARDSAAGAVV